MRARRRALLVAVTAAVALVVAALPAGAMIGDPDDAAIVRSTIELAHNLGLQLVAEGVEDQETLDLLGSLGCDLAQGFHLARPMPADDLARLAAGDARTHRASGLR
jgi:EAL domain-containing protein (putative c-di-GMP-specific phosphodiesterase class I)